MKKFKTRKIIWKWNSISKTERERDGSEESRDVAGIADVFVQHSHIGASRPCYCTKQSVFFAFSHSLFRPITDVDVFNCFQCTRLRASPIYRRWTPHWRPWSFSSTLSRTTCAMKPSLFPKPKYFSLFLSVSVYIYIILVLKRRWIRVFGFCATEVVVN